MSDTAEKRHLATAQANRFKMIQELAKELNDTQTKISKKGRTKLRKQPVKTIFRAAVTTYATEDHEYAAVGKFVQGMFRHVSSDKIFDKAEQGILTNIARVFGELDY